MTTHWATCPTCKMEYAEKDVCNMCGKEHYFPDKQFESVDKWGFFSTNVEKGWGVFDMIFCDECVPKVAGLLKGSMKK